MGRTLRSAGHQALMDGLKAARLDANLTQAELAALLNRPQSFVAKYENGERRIEVVEFVHIVNALDCEGTEFLRVIAEAEFGAP